MDLIKGDAMKKPMPLYVKPDRLLSVRDVQNGMRDHFEGTDLDMTKDAGAGPYKVPYRWRPMTFKVDGQEYTAESFGSGWMMRIWLFSRRSIVR